MKFEACMDVMDLLYENEETSVLYSSPKALAASIVVCTLTFPQLQIRLTSHFHLLTLKKSLPSLAGCCLCYYSTSAEVGVSCSSLG